MAAVLPTTRCSRAVRRVLSRKRPPAASSRHRVMQPLCPSRCWVTVLLHKQTSGIPDSHPKTRTTHGKNRSVFIGPFGPSQPSRCGRPRFTGGVDGSAAQSRQSQADSAKPARPGRPGSRAARRSHGTREWHRRKRRRKKTGGAAHERPLQELHPFNVRRRTSGQTGSTAGPARRSAGCTAGSRGCSRSQRPRRRRTAPGRRSTPGRWRSWDY